ncbi:MAG TPA: phosphoribosyltransferase family protein [Verrucomicrobiae bacterium]|nr:phosphoribosyltransferase family protein [Verrucomicrobiae bacterium]
MVFASREDAGRRLARLLQDRGVQADLVLGLPRGGVVVAAEVARVLRLPLDVLIVRKIGHPSQREFAVGALAENGVVVLDPKVVAPAMYAELQEVIQEEEKRLQGYQTRFHPGGLCSLEGKAVLLVDDGLATGATTEAAVLSARKQKARRITVAAPVASVNAVQRLEQAADAVVALCVDPDFDAVGRYYDVFSQTTDEEVLELLKAA